MDLAEAIRVADEDLLTRAINRNLTKRGEQQPLDPDSYIRSSSLPSLCFREEVLASLFRVTRPVEIDTDLRLIFDHGTGLHHSLQNLILPNVPDVLWGQWRCSLCGTLHRKDGVYGPKESWAGEGQGDPPDGFQRAPYQQEHVKAWEDLSIPSPEVCASCGLHSLQYEEFFFVDPELNIGGHCDGLLRFDQLPGFGVLEVKSIGNVWKVKNAPMFDHLLQVHCYMLFTGLKWGIIFYWHKGTNGIEAFKEHLVERDEDMIENIRDGLRQLRDALNVVQTTHEDDKDPEDALVVLSESPSLLPERICTTSTCVRAQKCSLREQCFAETTS